MMLAPQNAPRDRDIPQALRRFIIRRDGYRCRYCGVSLRNTGWHADHVYPASLGGLTVAENLVAACENCNLTKSDKLGIYPKPADYWYLLGVARAIRIPFFAAALVVVGLWVATLAFVWFGSTTVTIAGGGFVLCGLSVLFGWTKGRETR